LLIAERPDAQIDESGKIAQVDFYSWYALDDLDTLDQEYANVRQILGLTQLEETNESGGKCPDGEAYNKEKH